MYLKFICREYIKPADSLRVLQVSFVLLSTKGEIGGTGWQAWLLRAINGTKIMRLSSNKLSFKCKVRPRN